MTEEISSVSKVIDQLYSDDVELAKKEEEILLLRKKIKERIEAEKADDFGQLCWELYIHYNAHGYPLYKNKKKLLEVSYNIRENNRELDSTLEISKYWARVVFFGIRNAHIGVIDICKLAKGHLCVLNFGKTFRWGINRCQDGWEVFIYPSGKPYEGESGPNDWLPPYEDERFDYRLELDFSNYSYSFRWINGVYTFQGHCHSEYGVECFRKIFPEFSVTVNGNNSDDGWEVVVPIYNRLGGMILAKPNAKVVDYRVCEYFRSRFFG